MTAPVLPVHHGKRVGKMALGALGIVFGDIGTSPLYAVQECFAHGLAPVPDNVYGVISLIIWGLTAVVSIKYALIVMRADNHGEGGVFSLLALALRAARRAAPDEHERNLPEAVQDGHTSVWPIMLIGMLGAALFFGDSMVTPAISVLSAVEGLDVFAPALHEFVMPVTLFILVALFILQRFGSGTIGSSFGPIMVGWFCCLALLGLRAIVETPAILAALHPMYAVRFLYTHSWHSFAILGAVLLAFTGGEALFADMGHFGLRSVRLAWYGLVMPALIINYFGQGALLLAHPAAISSPFFMMVPRALLLPLIGLAAVATVIASQAVISGTFSIVRQAMQMDYLPRFSVVHTSALEQGQVYLPKVNLFLCVSVVMLVLIFRSSNALAGAYGFSVAGAMFVDTLLAGYVARHVWRWPRPLAALIFAPFVLFDVVFFSAAGSKIPEGGWLPLCVAAVVLTIFITWRQGRAMVHGLNQRRHEKMESFAAGIKPDWPRRSPGTSVYLAATTSVVPLALPSSLARYHTLRENVVILKIAKEDAPQVAPAHRATIHHLGKGIWQMELHYGYMEPPEVAQDFARQMQSYPEVDLERLTYFVGRSIFVPGPHHTFRPRWRKSLFLWLANSVEEEFDYARMPSGQLVQIGSQVEV